MKDVEFFPHPPYYCAKTSCFHLLKIFIKETPISPVLHFYDTFKEFKTSCKSEMPKQAKTCDHFSQIRLKNGLENGQSINPSP